ncbi:flippase [Methanosarcina sp. WH1]|uniref:flippase n=1 Tax=Methanosarcina sp. WH1 TaxID=1434102 RepID=UPI00061560EB|nr:flippase [Methanosarcina sp. WH1]AKB21090.1 polysaccharide biosynthesis protein [Methanosarcina sp. WH1]
MVKIISIGSSFTRIMQIEQLRRQSIVTLSTTILLTAIGFLSTMYFAHSVGESVLGSYFLFLAYFNTLTLILDGGLGGAAVKRISEGREKNEYFTTVFVLRIFLVGVSIIILLFARPILENVDQSGMYSWLFIALIIGIFWNSVSNGNYGSGKVGLNQTCGFISSAGCTVFQVIAVYLGFGANGLAGGFIFGMIAATVIGFHYLDLRFKRFNTEHLKSIFSYSFWIFLASSGSLVFSYADTIIIGQFLETADVGIYRVAFQFTTAATFTTLAMKTVLFPKVSNWNANGELKMAENAFAKGITYSLLLAVPVFAGGIILGDKMLYFFYGEGFARGTQTFYVLLAVQLVNVFMFLQTMYLNALNHPKESFKVTAVAATANIALDFMLIPILGILGAAVATLITMILNSLLAYLALKRMIHVRLEYQEIKNIAIATITMGLGVGCYRILVPLSNIWLTLIPIILGAILYVLLLLKLDSNIRSEIIQIGKQIGLQ